MTQHGTLEIRHLAVRLEGIDLRLVAITRARDVFDSCWTDLSEDERARADRFHRDVDRWRFVLTRSALRRVLGAELRERAQNLSFSYDQHKKPSLSLHPSLHFNASHAGEYGLIGISGLAPIGVDIEYYRDKLDELDIARTYFAAEELRVLNELDAGCRISTFYHMWTCKEAVAKAYGIGIARLNPTVTRAVLDGLQRGTEAEKTIAMVAGASVVPAPVPSGYFGAVAIILSRR